MKQLKKVLFASSIALLLGLLGLYLARPYFTMRRIEAHLAGKQLGLTGSIFDAVNQFDRPQDVLSALWKLTCDSKSGSSEGAGYVLALIASEELSLAAPLKISDELWWQRWADFMADLHNQADLTERERSVLARIEEVRSNR